MAIDQELVRFLRNSPAAVSGVKSYAIDIIFPP